MDVATHDTTKELQSEWGSGAETETETPMGMGMGMGILGRCGSSQGRSGRSEILIMHAALRGRLCASSSPASSGVAGGRGGGRDDCRAIDY